MINKLIPIKIPLLNPNEPEALLSSLYVSEGEKISPGQVVGEIETTKSASEIQAEAGGYLVGLRFNRGDTIPAGETLAYIGASPQAQDRSLPPWGEAGADKMVSTALPNGLRITEPARQLAIQGGLNLEALPHGPLVTEAMVKEQLTHQRSDKINRIPEGEKRVVIYGVGGHGRSLAAMIETLGNYEIIGFLDDGYLAGEKVLGMHVLGGMEQLERLAGEGVRLAVNGIGGIGDLESRLMVYKKLHQAGYICPSLVHPTAFLEQNAVLAGGVQVFPFAYVGTHVEIAYGCIVNTGTIISHDCVLSSYVNLSPGATLAGGVVVGEEALIGMRATVNLGVYIGKRARIGNGATIKADVPEGGVVPAGSIWPPRH